MRKEIELANDLDDLTARFVESAPDTPAVPPAQPIFFHPLEPDSAPGPTITAVVDGVRGHIAINQLSGIYNLRNDHALLKFDDGGSVVVDRAELLSVSRQLHRHSERLGARLRAEGMN